MSDMTGMISESINRIFSQRVDRNLLEAAENGVWQQQLWDTVEESGFADVLTPDHVSEQDGNRGGKWEDAYPVFHAIGFHHAPLPLSETIIARALLAEVGLQAPTGPITIAEQSETLKLVINEDTLILDGMLTAVPWARVAGSLLVNGRIGKQRMMAIISTDSPGMSVQPGVNAAKEARDRVTFEGTRCSAFVTLADHLPAHPLALFGALARSAMMAGAVERVLSESVQYANDRIQFGRPIGKFQAIQQSLAILAGEVTAAQTATLAACMSAGRLPHPFVVAMAKVRAGKAAGIAASIGHQVHGAIGFTYEHSLHFATRRLWSWRAEYGAESHWAEQVGICAINRGGQNFWSDLTRRSRPMAH